MITWLTATSLAVRRHAIEWSGRVTIPVFLRAKQVVSRLAYSPKFTTKQPHPRFSSQATVYCDSPTEFMKYTSPKLATNLLSKLASKLALHLLLA